MAICAAAAAAEAGAEAKPLAAWSVFRSDTGRFRVELPGVPRVERSRRSTLLGAVEETKYLLRPGRGERAGDTAPVALAVEVRDIPRLAARFLPPSTILELACEGVLRDKGAEPMEARGLTLHGFPARDFTYRVPPPEARALAADAGVPTPEVPVSERAIVVLVDHRIHLVTGMAPGSPDAHPGIARFFASFRFWREEAAP